MFVSYSFIKCVIKMNCGVDEWFPIFMRERWKNEDWNDLVSFEEVKAFCVMIYV